MTISEDVRRACDAEVPSRRSTCGYPDCTCEIGERESLLTTLLADAHAAGAAEERAACEFVALCGDLLTKDIAEAEYGARLREHIGDCIRARAPQQAAHLEDPTP